MRYDWCWFLILLGACMPMTACADSDSEEAACNQQAVAAVKVSVTDMMTGLPLTEAQGVSGLLSEGSFMEQMGSVELDGGNVLEGAFERTGVYTVEVSAPGYAPWKASPVVILHGVCHVNTAHLDARLIPE